MALGFPPQSKVSTNLSYLGQAFGSPFNTMIECYTYTNNKTIRAYGGQDKLASFVLPIPVQFQSQIVSETIDARAKEGGVVAYLKGLAGFDGGFAIDQEITQNQLDQISERIMNDINIGITGRDTKRVMDNTDNFFIKNEKRVYEFTFAMVLEDAKSSADILKTFESLSAFALPEAIGVDADLFRVKPPAMATVTIGHADEGEDGSTTVYNTNTATEKWLSNPKLCLIQSVSVGRDASSMFYSPEYGPMPSEITATVVLKEIEPLFRAGGDDGAVVATRSQVLVEGIS